MDELCLTMGEALIAELHSKLILAGLKPACWGLKFDSGYLSQKRSLKIGP